MTCFAAGSTIAVRRRQTVTVELTTLATVNIGDYITVRTRAEVPKHAQPATASACAWLCSSSVAGRQACSRAALYACDRTGIYAFATFYRGHCSAGDSEHSKHVYSAQAITATVLCGPLFEGSFGAATLRSYVEPDRQMQCKPILGCSVTLGLFVTARKWVAHGGEISLPPDMRDCVRTFAADV